MKKSLGVLIHAVALIVCAVFCGAAVGSAWAQDWPQWRGPNRDGAAPFTEPKVWPEKLTTKWKVTIGEGYASPLYAGGRILEFARLRWRALRTREYVQEHSTFRIKRFVGGAPGMFAYPTTMARLSK